MILVDSSVWINYFNKNSDVESEILDDIVDKKPILVADLVYIEVLQGYRNKTSYLKAKNLLDGFTKVNLLSEIGKEEIIENYRKLRSKGITIGTIDNIISTYCISNNLPLLFSDKDYRHSVKHLGLRDFSKEFVN